MVDIPFKRPEKAGKARYLSMLAMEPSHLVVPRTEPVTMGEGTYMNEGREALRRTRQTLQWVLLNQRLGHD